MSIHTSIYPMTPLPWDEELWGHPFQEFEKRVNLNCGDIFEVKSKFFWTSDWHSKEEDELQDGEVLMFLGYAAFDREERVTNTALALPALAFLYKRKVLFWAAGLRFIKENDWEGQSNHIERSVVKISTEEK